MYVCMYVCMHMYVCILVCCLSSRLHYIHIEDESEMLINSVVVLCMYLYVFVNKEIDKVEKKQLTREELVKKNRNHIFPEEAKVCIYVCMCMYVCMYVCVYSVLY